MRIAILSRMPRSYSTRRLKEAAAARGHKAHVLDTLKFCISLEQEKPCLYYQHRRLQSYDAVIPRIGSSITFYGLAVARQFEQMGVYVLNESVAIARSRDKLRATQILSRHDIGIPSTEFVRDRADIIPAIRRVGGVPVIVKVLEGTQGIGVILADSEKMAEAIIQTLQSARQNVLIQKFVRESEGKDIRALVVGDRVVAAMRRSAQAGEFRSNVHQGGTVEGVTLDEEYGRTAVRAAQIMGLNVAGVDMLESDEGPQVMEVNSSPGLEGIEIATGVDVARAIIDNIEQNVLFPEVDLKRRLRLTGGYVIAEVPVHDMPALEGKRLNELNLPEKKVLIMSIVRSDAVIPVPQGEEMVREGDVLVCYGPPHELQLLMPKRKKRALRRTRKLKP